LRGKKDDKGVLAQALHGIFRKIMFQCEGSVPFPQQSYLRRAIPAKHEYYVRAALPDINVASGGR
jgi:hypothetical protein